jgi:hypothetical protein
VRCILTLAFRRDVALPAFEAVIRLEILQVFDLIITKAAGCVEEIVLCVRGSEASVGDVDRSVVAVIILRSGAVVVLELGMGLAAALEWSTFSTHTFFNSGHMSFAVQPSVFQESKSLRWARVYLYNR